MTAPRWEYLAWETANRDQLGAELTVMWARLQPTLRATALGDGAVRGRMSARFGPGLKNVEVEMIASVVVSAEFDGKGK